MNMKHSVKIAAITVLSVGFIATPTVTAQGSSAEAKAKTASAEAKAKPAEAKEKAAKSAEAAKPEKHAGEHARGIDAALAQFDTDGDGAISEAEKAAAGERYRRVTEAMARRDDGSQQRAERMARRDDMKAAKETVDETGSEAKRGAVEAMKADKEATRESVESGAMTKEEAKAAKKDQKRWWQFWKTGS
jgi:hypothetical protein